MSVNRVHPLDRQREGVRPDEPLRLHGRRLVLARVVWLLTTLAAVSIFITGIPLHFRRLLTPCEGDGCVEWQLTTAAIIAFEAVGYAPEAYAAVIVGAGIAVALVYVTMGLIIFWRKSEEWMAWLASLWMVTFGVTLFEGEVRAVAATYPWLTAPVYILILLGGVFLLAPFFLVFPNGRFVPRWARWAYFAAVIVFPVFTVSSIYFRNFFALIENAGYALWGGMVLGGVAAQVYRYLRVSNPVERQQTKWVMYGLLTLPLALSVILLIEGVGSFLGEPALEAAAKDAARISVAAIAFATIPVTIGFSLLRYRLWDTDIIVNRAMVYGALTATLALLYFGSVVLFQQVLQGFAGQDTQLAIVASTLLIAALFSPLRRRVQGLIDRRFYRRKYDAGQTLARFAQTAQNEVELNHLADELLAAVQEAMQPDTASLWLRNDGGQAGGVVPDGRGRR